MRRLPLVLSGLVLVATAGCINPMRFITHGMDVKVGKPVAIVTSDAASGWGNVSHPAVWALTDSRFMLSYTLIGDTAGGSGIAAADWPAYTDDAGKTWQFGDPITWLDGKPPHQTEGKRGQPTVLHYGYRGAICRRSNGERVACEFPCNLNSHGMGVVHGIWSTNNGASWHGPRDVTLRVPSPDTPIYLMPLAVELPDGSIVCAAQIALKEDGDYSRSVLLRSVDGGQSYDLYSTIASHADAPWGSEGPSETSIVLLPSGELLAVCRTGSGGAGSDIKSSPSMLLARSNDGGLTWERSRMRLSGVWPQLLVMSNGILALAYGRPGNAVAFSADGGRHWISETALTAADVRTSGYMGMVEVSPGRLLVVYDSFNTSLSKIWLWEPPDPINVIFGVFVDVTYRGQ